MEIELAAGAKEGREPRIEEWRMMLRGGVRRGDVHGQEDRGTIMNQRGPCAQRNRERRMCDWRDMGLVRAM